MCRTPAAVYRASFPAGEWEELEARRRAKTVRGNGAPGYVLNAWNVELLIVMYAKD
jgi:hypothetical protein